MLCKILVVLSIITSGLGLALLITAGGFGLPALGLFAASCGLQILAERAY